MRMAECCLYVKMVDKYTVVKLLYLSAIFL